jgi:hypothetical protein
MKHALCAVLALGTLCMGCGSSDRSTPYSTAPATQVAGVQSFTGNGGPSGAHYTLNIIGVPKNKSASLTGNNGRRIFVPLKGKTRILLTEGTDFQVLDANATDGAGGFSLPNPDPNNDGITEYSVFARALGKPGGSSTTTTAAVDPATGDTYYSVYNVVMVREKGGPKFENVSRELLYVFADIDGDGVVDRVPLFDDRLQDYFWEYDNNGLKLVQLRFYEVQTKVTK